MPPTLVSYTQSARSNVTPTTGLATASIAVQAGDKVVIAGGAEDASQMGTITLSFTGGLTSALTAHQSDQTSNYSPCAIASADVNTSGNITGKIVGTNSSTAPNQVVAVWVLRNHGGIGVTGKAHQAAASAPLLNLAGVASDSLLLCILTDWSASGVGPTANATYLTVDGSSPTQRLSFADNGSTWHVDIFDYPATTSSGTKTVGETFPTAQTPNLLAVEILTGVTVPASAAGQYGWGTYGGGDYGPNFGASGTPISASESFSFTEQASVVQIAVATTDALTQAESPTAIAADVQTVDSFTFAELSAIAATLATLDSLTHSESPSSVAVQQLLSAVDSWTLTELSSLQTQTDMAANDSATHSESPSTVAADLQRADAGSFSDASAISAAVATSDSGGFSDASALQQTNTVSANETHTQGEASAVDATMSRADSWAFTDLSAVAADLQRTDSWALTESPGSIQSVNLISASDSWTVADVVASLTSTDAKSATDTLTVTDTVQDITASVSASELIGLLESSAISAALLTGEAFSASELSAVQAVQLVNASDTQTHNEQNSSVAATTSASDSGTFGESALVAGTVFQSANDTQVQDEQSAIAADLSRSDSSAFNDTSSLTTILTLSASDSAAQNEQPSTVAAALTASDASAVTDAVLALAQTVQKAANDSFGLNESSSLAQIVAITRTDTFTLSVESAGVVELTVAPYIHHKVPLDGLVQELPVGGTVLAMIADGVVVSAVTTGLPLNNATLGTPPTYGGSGTVLDAVDAGTSPAYAADATVD